MPTFQPSVLPTGAYRINNKNHDYWIVDADGNIIGQTGANGQDTFFAVAETDPLTGGIKVSTGTHLPISADGKAGPDAILTKDGRVLYSLTSPTQTIGVTTASHALTTERQRFGAYTRKVTVNAATQSELRFGTINITTDADDPAFSIDIYIEQIPDGNLVSPNHPYMAFVLSNANAAITDYKQYIFDASYMRQGWNTFKVRGADVNNTKTAGNMALGSSFNVAGAGCDFSQPIRYLGIQFKNMNGAVVHLDDVRQPARAKTVFTIGFDANMEIMESHVAPLFKKHGIKSYTTFTGVYEEATHGTAWERMKRLQSDYGWDILNHTTNHGATTPGRAQPITLTRVSNIVTGVLGSAHGIPLNVMFKAKIATATTGDLNGIFDCYASSTTDIKYTAVGANVTDEVAAIRTIFSDVLEADTAENRRLLTHEVTHNTETMKAFGLDRQPGAMVWPNNSVPQIDMVNDICHAAGIYIGRGMRRGYCSVNEFGIDNPLHIGSQDMDSGTTSYTRLSGMKARVRGAIDRGEHCWIYGHYIQLVAEAGGAVDIDYPPGQGGNPAPPAGALSGVGGWWYYEMLEDLIETTIAPAVSAGEAIVMLPSELAKFMDLSD